MRNIFEAENPRTFASLIFDAEVLVMTENWKKWQSAPWPFLFRCHFEDPSLFTPWSLLPSLRDEEMSRLRRDESNSEVWRWTFPFECEENKSIAHFPLSTGITPYG